MMRASLELRMRLGWRRGGGFWCAGAVAAAVAFGVALPARAQSDVESRAMHDEMQRSLHDLKLDAADRPYYIAYKIVDSDRLEAQAALGALVSSGVVHTRVLSVTVRVGSYEQDNSNYSAPNGGMAALLGLLGSAATQLPVDENYEEIRRKIWLATDSAYKKAVEDLSAKKAAQQNRNRAEPLADFSQEPARQESEMLPPIPMDVAAAERLVRTASALFRTLPQVESSVAQFQVVNATERFLNSEGTSYTRQVPDVSFRAQASMQNTTGEIFSDQYASYGHSLADLAPEKMLLSQSQAVVERLTLRRKGKAAKRYNGPVLLTGEAAAELFAHHFANQLAAHRAAGGENNALSAMLGGNTASLLNKIGSRVLPDFLTVTDDPHLKQADGRPLLGGFTFDEEGVPTRETVLVKDGVLKTLLTSRTPVRGLAASTGNLRNRGVYPGNLVVSSTKAVPADELKKQLLELVKTRGLEYGYILRSLAGNVAPEAVRIYPDGREEAVRDARVNEISVNSFKDILAVSETRTVYTEPAPITSILNLAPFSGDDLISYVVPDLLFEDMTVEHVPNDTPTLPPVPSPLASK